MKGIPALLLAMLCSACAGVEYSTDNDPWSEDGVLELRLEPVRFPQHDLQRLQLRLTATNTGTEAIVLDREMCAGFSLRFETDLSEEPFHSDERDVSTEAAEALERPPADAARARFVALEPGESLSRTIDLARPVRAVVEGHLSDAEMVHYGFYGEAMMRVTVPEAASSLTATAWYERGVWMMAWPQFEEWHGASPDEVGLWQGRARSNSATVRSD